MELAGSPCDISVVSLESFFSGPGDPLCLRRIASCLTSVGTPAFNTDFPEMIEQVIKADQSMVFADKGDRPVC